MLAFLGCVWILCKMPKEKMDDSKNDLIQVAIPSIKELNSAIETLGRSFSKRAEDGESAVLVFGRMILGLDEEADMYEEDTETEPIPKSWAPNEEMAESVSPIMDTVQLAEEWSVTEIDDSTSNCTFRIPSPDIVDETVYTVSRPFCMPLRGYRVTSRFGYRIHPISGNTTFHYGADLAAGTGTKVVAVADGTIRETGYGNINGNYVKMSHTDGYVSHYTHLHTIHVSEGQKVMAGQKVGTVGSTGYSTGPHLHFELRKDGKVLDPFNYFSF